MADANPRSERFEVVVHRLGAVLLAAFTILWWFAAKQLLPSSLLAPTTIGMAWAIGAFAYGRGRTPQLAAPVAALILMLWIATTYRLPSASIPAPSLSLDEIPLGRLLLPGLTACCGAFLIARLIRWIGGSENVRFAVFLIALLPWLLVSGDLAALGSRLQPLRPPNYHPFFAYRVPNSYQYAHALERNVVDLKGVKFQQVKSDDRIRIVLSGASTVWGVGLEHDESLPVVLQRELESRYPEHRFEVITVAYPGKYQLNELIDSVVTLPHWNPDVVISLNGFNEIWYGEDDDRYEGMPYIEYQMRTRGTLATLANRFSHFAAYRFAVQRDNSTSPYGLKQADDQLGPRYENYLRATARNLRQHDIPYVYGFCPNVRERLDPHEQEQQILMDEESWQQQAAPRRAAANAVIREQQQHVYDVMQPLNQAGSATAMFMDPCHLTPEGVERVATDLARRLPEWCSRLRSATDKPGRDEAEPAANSASDE